MILFANLQHLISMSKRSDAVKRWRKSTKDKIVKAMGGCCQICRYNRCHAALALHHIDPGKKNFGFGAIRASPKNIKKIIKELKKCILLCHICHTEFHEGLIKLPEKIKILDVSFFDNIIKEKHDSCPICKKPKLIINRTCSLKCAGKKRYGVKWESVPVEWFKTKSNVFIADFLGCSDVAVKKYKKRSNIE
jgi:hypothetical protein